MHNSLQEGPTIELDNCAANNNFTFDLLKKHVAEKEKSTIDWFESKWKHLQLIKETNFDGDYFRKELSELIKENPFPDPSDELIFKQGVAHNPYLIEYASESVRNNKEIAHKQIGKLVGHSEMI